MWRWWAVELSPITTALITLLCTVQQKLEGAHIDTGHQSACLGMSTLQALAQQQMQDQGTEVQDRPGIMGVVSL